MCSSIIKHFISFCKWIWRGKPLYKKIIRWLWYGVFLSFVPYLMVILFFLIVGYKIDILNTLPDYLLVTFAVAVNALSMETDDEKEINSDIRSVFKTLSVVTLFVTAIFYFGIFNYDFMSKVIFELLKKNIENVSILEKGVTIALVLNILFGILMEICDFAIKRKSKIIKEEKTKLNENHIYREENKEG